MTNHQPLIAPRFLFRFSVPFFYRRPLWTDQGAQLAESYRLDNLAELDEAPTLADVRFAWSEEGVAFSLRVDGKRQPPWCRESRLEDSDGFQIWIDTRATHNIHRATRYCHRFIFLPTGGGRQYEDAVADQVLINRARENARPVRPGQLSVQSKLSKRGYLLEGLIPKVALTGFDPDEHSSLGFTYAVTDRELGRQTFSVGSGFPYEEDPSTWATLELVR